MASSTGRTRREPRLTVNGSAVGASYTARPRTAFIEDRYHNVKHRHPTNTHHMSGDGCHTQTNIKHTREHRQPNGPNPLTPHMNNSTRPTQRGSEPPTSPKSQNPLRRTRHPAPWSPQYSRWGSFCGGSGASSP